jgi:hypothetical protein
MTVDASALASAFSARIFLAALLRSRCPAEVEAAANQPNGSLPKPIQQFITQYTYLQTKKLFAFLELLRMVAYFNYI